MQNRAQVNHLIGTLFLPGLAAQLLPLPNEACADLLRKTMGIAFASLPAVIHDSLVPASLSETEREEADALVEYKMLLMDGSVTEMGLPYDWYYGVSDGHVGPKAPRYIIPRIAFAHVLVKAWRTTSDQRYAQALRHYIIDYVSRYWQESDQLPDGDNWLCTSCRCGSWNNRRFHGILEVLTDTSLLAYFSFADLLLIFQAINNMMNGLIPNLALGSNWRVHELTNIFSQGLCYPFLKNSAFWREVGVNGLNEEFDVQFHADGSHEEFCITYGSGTWLVFAHYFVLAHQAPELGFRFDRQKMLKAFEYYLSACKPFGLTSAIGDVYAIRNQAMLDGHSPPHANESLPDWDATVKQGAQLMLAVDAFPSAQFVGKGSPPPAWASRYHPDSGYFFMRDGWEPEDLFASINLGHYSNCHCHLGLLGIEIAGLGREFIVDPGNSSLDPRPLNQNFARTRAHNTLSVDGLDQQVAVPVQLSRIYTGKNYDFAVGVYKGGYTIGNPYGCGCTSSGQFDNCFSGSHFRHLLFVKDSYWLLFDAITTRPGHTVETRLQFLPTELEPLPNGGYATSWDEANLALLPLQWDHWEHQVLAGQENPIEGWIPSMDGAILPAPVYRATCASDHTPCWHGTLLFPFRDRRPPAIEIVNMDCASAGFAYRIRTDAYTDYVFLSNSWMPVDIAMDDIRTNAPCVHLRVEEDEVTQLFTCEGTHLEKAGTFFFDAPGTMLAREFLLASNAVTDSIVKNPRYPQPRTP